MIEYQKILDKNMLNVFKDILQNIRDKGLSDNNHLYITFLTNYKNVKLPKWLKIKYPVEMTIVIQHEYYNLEINEKNFSISLSFDNIDTNIAIDYNSIISFADPSVNFGLILKSKKTQKEIKKDVKSNNINTNNVINFSNYKKN